MPVFAPRLALAVLLTTALAACQPDAPDYPEAPTQIEPLALRAEASALQPPIRVEGTPVQVRVPGGWSVLDSTAAARAHRAVRVAAEHARGRPWRVYGEQRTSSFLAIAVLDAPSGRDVATAVHRALDADRASFLRVDTLRTGNGPALMDFVLASQSTVHHKLLWMGPDGPTVQFDYVTPRYQYPRIVPLIDASAASIQRVE